MVWIKGDVINNGCDQSSARGINIVPTRNSGLRNPPSRSRDSRMHPPSPPRYQQTWTKLRSPFKEPLEHDRRPLFTTPSGVGKLMRLFGGYGTHHYATIKTPRTPTVYATKLSVAMVIPFGSRRHAFFGMTHDGVSMHSSA